MQSFVRVSTVFLILSIFSLPSTGADTLAKPVAKVELLALVAGGALRENVVHEIGANGLGFRADDDYRSQLKAAGADATILAAVNAAKLVAAPSSQPESPAGAMGGGICGIRGSAAAGSRFPRGTHEAELHLAPSGRC